MCIICNCPEAGDDFVREFAAAQIHMEAAAKSMLACSKVASGPEQREQYDATHKQIMRLQGEWNKLEHTREHRPQVLHEVQMTLQSGPLNRLEQP